MTKQSFNHIMIIAGEASGDMRAAGLARAIKELSPSVKLTGIGGKYMREAGVDCFCDITELAVIGIAEVVKNFSRIKKVFDQTVKKIEETNPDAVILVDYPGFNLRLAEKIVSKGLSSTRFDVLRFVSLRGARRATKQSNSVSPKIFYYISPQVWAWREGRVNKIKNLVDRMIVLFPFEKDIYAKYGMTVDYVGHPLVDEVIVEKNQTEVLKAIGLSASKTTIGLMPGSRIKEVERHLPCMLEAARILFQQNKDRQFILIKSSSICEELILSVIASEAKQSFDLPLKIYDGAIYDGINAMDAAMVASGTATLETALLKKPMVVIYKTSWLTYAIAKQVIKIPYIGLVNIVAGKKIVEELIQNDANAMNIAKAIESALHNQQIIEDLSAVKSSLGHPGASLRAAQVILKTL